MRTKSSQNTRAGVSREEGEEVVPLPGSKPVGHFLCTPHQLTQIIRGRIFTLVTHRLSAYLSSFHLTRAFLQSLVKKNEIDSAQLRTSLSYLPPLYISSVVHEDVLAEGERVAQYNVLPKRAVATGALDDRKGYGIKNISIGPRIGQCIGSMQRWKQKGADTTAPRFETGLSFLSHNAASSATGYVSR